MVLNFLYDECLNSETTDEFYKNCMKRDAVNKNVGIKHIATLEDGKATVGLTEIDTTHPFYSLQGSDNMIIITSNYYSKNKLIIRGVGADVTAAGIISDIVLTTSNIL